MLMLKLGCTVSTLCKINRHCLLQIRNMSKKMDDDDDKPIPFSSSAAASWKAQYNRIPPNEQVWYTPYIVSGSVTIFLLYFCVFREENDIDELIYKPLPQTIKGIEKAFPDHDFNTKPEYVAYYEDQKKKEKL